MTTAPKVKKKLSDMEISEISIVDNPANEDARVVIVKAASTRENIRSKDMADGNIRKDAEDHEEEHIDIEGGDEGFTLEDLVEGLAEAGHDDLAEVIAELADENDAYLDAVEEAGVEIAKRDTRIAELEGVIQKSGVKLDTPASDALALESLPADIRKMVETSNLTAQAALEEVAKARAEREERDSIAKAASFGIPAPETFGPLLMRIEKGLSDEDDAELVAQTLAAFAKQADASPFFKAIGDAGGDAAAPDAVLTAKADEIRKANPTLSPQQAIAKALEENPRLYEEAQIAKRRGW